MPKPEPGTPEYALAAANKLVRPALLSGRLKSDWFGACEMFEQAAQGFKKRGDWQVNDCLPAGPRSRWSPDPPMKNSITTEAPSYLLPPLQLSLIHI